MFSAIANGFAAELLKLAREGYVPVKGMDYEVLEGIPVIKRLPRDNERALEQIRKTLGKGKGREVLGHRNILVPEKVMGDIKSLGFKPTKLAVPLPGEKAFTVSWRKGDLHIHKAGPTYLVHQDKNPPKGILSSVYHGITEGIPAIRKRSREKLEAVLPVEKSEE